MNCSTNKGFVAVLMTAFLPIVIGLLSLFFVFIVDLAKIENSKWNCRDKALSISHFQAKKINQLQALNPKAEKLRMKRKVAAAAYKAALKTKNPKVIVPAGAYLEKIKKDQLALKIKQQSILRTAKIQSYSAHYFGRASLSKLGYIKVNIQGRKALQVKAIPRQSNSPSYYPHKNFRKRQRIKITYRFKKYKIQCEASPLKLSSKWRAHPHES